MASVSPQASLYKTRSKSAWLDRAKSIAPIIVREADRVEREATITTPVYEALADTGLFWVMLPQEIGGGGADIVTTIEVIEELSRADGSTGWAFMVNAAQVGIAGAFLNDDGVNQLFGSANKAILAGMLNPIGHAREVEGGLYGGGRYQFASGSAYSTHIGAGFHVRGADGQPRMLENGLPDARIGFIPRETVNFLGNWDVMGLVGTGSYDYEVPDQFVPESLTLSTFATDYLRGGPVFALGILGLAVSGHCGVALGLMKRALEEVTRIASAKTRLGYTGTIAEFAVFQHEFCLHEAAYWSVRGFVLDVFADAEHVAASGGKLTPEHMARFRQATTVLHNVASDVVGFCHLWGSTQAFRNPSALGRCTRDMAVATQHLLMDQKSLSDAAPDIIASWNSEH